LLSATQLSELVAALNVVMEGALVALLAA